MILFAVVVLPMKTRFFWFVSWGLVSILSGQLVVMPVQAARKALAIVPVYATTSTTKDVPALYSQLKNELLQTQQQKLVSDDDLLDYFAQEEQGSESISAGDQLYIEAKQSYLQFDNKKAEKLLNEALLKYAQNPGTQGGFYQAYLLLAFMEHENGQGTKAKKHIENALSYHPNASQLTDSFFSPRFCQTYKAVAEEFTKNHPTTLVSVQVIGQNDNSAVFVNGIQQGFGPKVEVSAVLDQNLFVQAGSMGKLYQVKPRQGQDNKIKIRGKLVKNKSSQGLAFGFPSNLPNLTQESRWLGKNVNASQVALLSFQNAKTVDLSVVDVATGKVAETRSFELNQQDQGFGQTSKVMARYLVSLDKKDFKDNAEDGMPIVSESQKKSNGWLWATAGVALAAGVGGALLLGGSSSGASTTSDVQVELPPFDEE